MERNTLEHKEYNKAIFIHELSHYLFLAHKHHLIYSKEMLDLMRKHMDKIENGSEEDVMNVAKFVAELLCSINVGSDLCAKVVAAYAIAIRHSKSCPEVSRLAISYAMNEEIEDAQILTYPRSVIGKS